MFYGICRIIILCPPSKGESQSQLRTRIPLPILTLVPERKKQKLSVSGRVCIEGKEKSILLA